MDTWSGPVPEIVYQKVGQTDAIVETTWILIWMIESLGLQLEIQYRFQIARCSAVPLNYTNIVNIMVVCTRRWM